MKLIFCKVQLYFIILGVLSSYKASAHKIDCYVCESGLEESREESCEIAHEKHLETCDTLVNNTVCKTEWKLDKDKILIWVNRSCSDKAVSSEAYCNDDWSKQTNGQCFCEKDKCNSHSFKNAAWKSKNYKYSLGTTEIVFIVLSCVGAVLLIGSGIWWFLKRRKAKKNRVLATVETEREAEIQDKIKASSPYGKSDHTQEKILHKMSMDSIEHIGKSKSTKFEPGSGTNTGSSTPNP